MTDIFQKYLTELYKDVPFGMYEVLSPSRTNARGQVVCNRKGEISRIFPLGSIRLFPSIKLSGERCAMKVIKL